MIVCMCPGLSRFSCGAKNNITPAQVTDQLLDTLESKDVTEAAFFSDDSDVYFDVSAETILRFCSGTLLQEGLYCVSSHGTAFL